MRKRKNPGVCFFLGFLALALLSGTFPAQAAVDKKDELQIGIPDLPRRINSQLPAIQPDRQIQAGVLRFHPSFESKIEFDDNIHLQPNDKYGDVIFTQTPGLSADMNLGDHRVEAGYGMEIVNFAKDQEENALNHMAHARTELNFNDLQIVAQDLFEKSTGRTFSETSVRDVLLINTVDVLARYDRPRWAAETGWRHNTIDHRIPSLDRGDYEEDVLVLLGGYKIAPKTLALIETDLGRVRFDGAGRANQEYWQILGGLRGEPSELFTLTAKLGFQGRQLGDVSGQGPQSDYEGLVANLDMIYRLSDRDTLRGGYNRTVKTSTFGNSSWYRQDRIFLSYAKRFADKWMLTPQAGWQLNDYPEEGTSGNVTKIRSDVFWTAGIDLRYKIQEWLSTGLTYKFRSRNSNIDPLDFENNRLALDVSFIY